MDATPTAIAHASAIPARPGEEKLGHQPRSAAVPRVSGAIREVVNEEK